MGNINSNKKYTSRRFLISLWSVIMVTFIVGVSLLKEYEPSWLATTLPALISIILAFVGMESWNKKSMYQNMNSNNSDSNGK